MTPVYNKFLEFLEQYSDAKKIQILHRGFNKEVAFKKFNLDPKYNSLEQFGERLFFFGEKSRNFQIEINSLKYDINDISIELFQKIFYLFKNLESEHIPDDFYGQNIETFNYFDIINLENFLKEINKLDIQTKLYLRNYYLTILHQLDYNDFKDVSFMLSSSKNKSEAKNHSIGEAGIVINFWRWENEKLNFNNTNLPYFTSVPYPKEEEETILGVIFPHFIYSFESEGKVYINPNIPDLDDYEMLFYFGLEIDQSNFKEKLKLMTSYHSHLENSNGVLKEI